MIGRTTMEGASQSSNLVQIGSASVGEEGTSRIRCDCGEEAVEKVSRTKRNPGRRFVGCRRWNMVGGCRFFRWVDTEFPDEATPAISDVMATRRKEMVINSALIAELERMKEIVCAVKLQGELTLKAIEEEKMEMEQEMCCMRVETEMKLKSVEEEKTKVCEQLRCVKLKAEEDVRKLEEEKLVLLQEMRSAVGEVEQKVSLLEEEKRELEEEMEEEDKKSAFLRRALRICVLVIVLLLVVVVK